MNVINANISNSMNIIRGSVVAVDGGFIDDKLVDEKCSTLWHYLFCVYYLNLDGNVFHSRRVAHILLASY